jgi:CBS domain-containing protein
MPNVQEIMSSATCTVGPDSTIAEAAKRMRDEDVGDVIVVSQDDRIQGIVTDRDIAVRAVAEGRNPESTTVSDICSPDLVTVGPDEDVSIAVDRMREHAVRRLPVVEGGRAVGIVSLGDLAMERDPDSALGDISSAPPNN